MFDKVSNLLTVHVKYTAKRFITSFLDSVWFFPREVHFSIYETLIWNVATRIYEQFIFKMVCLYMYICIFQRFKITYFNWKIIINWKTFRLSIIEQMKRSNKYAQCTCCKYITTYDHKTLFNHQ